MHRARSFASQSNSFFPPEVVYGESSIDGLPISTPWLSTEECDELPSSSQSWPTASDIQSSFGTAGEEVYSPEEESLENSEWSPAAAFLSSFTSPTSTLPPDASGQTIAGYTLGPTIGHGGFSTIKEATSPSGGVVAIKIVRHCAFANLPASEKARQRSRLSHEARLWVSLSHENILPLFDSHRTSQATYLVTLYCPAGSLLDILKREGTPALEQTDAGCMFRQVVKALQYLHETVYLVHGDVKLENVLVDESGVCRLSDFGLSRRIGGDSSQVSSGDEDDEAVDPKRTRSRGTRTGTNALPVHLSLMRHGPQRHRHSSPFPRSDTPPPTHPDHMFQPGSLPYAAPELLLPHVHSSEPVHGSRPTAHPAQDMWALGVLLYALLTGVMPFRDAFEPRLQMKILRGTYDMPPGTGPLAESVLKGCLEREVSDRWTISMVDDAAWGIGYGNVELDPVLCEEQRSQSQSRLSPPQGLVASMSDLSVSRGRSSRPGIRSQSRSPSPSVAPRTPEDDDEVATFYGARRRRRPVPRDESDVQIVGAEWDSRDGVFDEEVDTDHDKKPADGARRRPDVSGEFNHDTKD